MSLERAVIRRQLERFLFKISRLAELRNLFTNHACLNVGWISAQRIIHQFFVIQSESSSEESKLKS
jgi:hypothetical protein